MGVATNPLSQAYAGSFKQNLAEPIQKAQAGGCEGEIFIFPLFKTENITIADENNKHI